jgi:hypothetical protein
MNLCANTALAFFQLQDFVNYQGTEIKKVVVIYRKDFFLEDFSINLLWTFFLRRRDSGWFCNWRDCVTRLFATGQICQHSCPTADSIQLRIRCSMRFKTYSAVWSSIPESPEGGGGVGSRPPTPRIGLSVGSPPSHECNSDPGASRPPLTTRLQIRISCEFEDKKQKDSKAWNWGQGEVVGKTEKKIMWRNVRILLQFFKLHKSTYWTVSTFFKKKSIS